MSEPLLFVAWTMHEVKADSGVSTIRVTRGNIEFNPKFICQLKRSELQSVLAFEATRILLGHPYSRRQPRADLSYTASNISVQECLHTSLPMPFARDVFGGESFNHQYFEFYYNQLFAQSQEEPPPPDQNDEAESDQSDSPQTDSPDSNANPEMANDSPDVTQPDPSDTSDDSQPRDHTDESDQSSSDNANLQSYTDANSVGAENAADWDADDLFRDEMVTAIGEAEKSGQWGSLPGAVREQLMATLRPPLDYRGVLRHFRQSVLSIDRRLTRMKPSRRYGMNQMGSRYDFTTKLLFAVDVSGSMSHRELRDGFSVANQFFNYGIRELDVLWFDTQIHGEPISFRRARSSIEVTGRGGTDFQCLIDFIDDKPQYDGMIVYTDGEAAKPSRPTNRRAKLLWLFSTQAAHEKMHHQLKELGRCVFIKPSPTRRRQH